MPPSDIFIGGTASASSEFSGLYLAEYAFDKSMGTRWGSSAGPPAWVQYDFAADKYTAYDTSITPLSGRVKDFRISGSDNDFVEETIVYSGQCEDNGTTQNFLIEDTTGYSAYRLYVDSYWGTSIVVVYEWVITGETTAEPEPYSLFLEFNQTISSNLGLYLEFNQSIASFITIPFVQRISMATRLYYGFQQILAQAKRANLEFAQTFDTATPIYFPFEFPIAGLQAVQIAFDQIFHGFGPPVALEFLQTWYSQGYDVAFLPFAQVIGSEVEAALQEIQFSVTVAGVRVGVSKCTFDRQGFANYANITLRERKDYNNKQSGDIVTLTYLGEQCTLMVVNKPFDEQLGQGSVERSYVLECISITSQLSEDFNDSLAASRINVSYPAGTMASVILDDLTAGVCSYSLNVFDFQTGGFDFEDSERFSALRAVFPENYGWIISTNKAGVLQIGAFVVPYLGGSGHKSLYFERKSLIPPDGVLYNQVKLSNYNKEPGSQGTTGLRIEVVDNGNGTGTIYGYSVPWTPNFAIYDSEDATAPSLIIQGGGIEEVEVEDPIIEFIDYSAGLSKPVYSAPVFDWGGNDSLEPISYDEAGNLTTEQLNGYSVAANVTYITKRKVWTYDNSRTDITQVRIKYQ